VLRVALPTYRATRLLEFHSGAIHGLDTHPGDHVVATAGEDATVTSLACLVCSFSHSQYAYLPVWSAFLVGDTVDQAGAKSKGSDSCRLERVIEQTCGPIKTPRREFHALLGHQGATEPK
jgi:hypothetical protein